MLLVLKAVGAVPHAPRTKFRQTLCMTAPSCSLRPALQEDLREILTWMDTPELMQRWGGPLLPFPGSPAATWEIIGGSEETTFALVSPFNKAFSQPTSQEISSQYKI